MYDAHLHLHDPRLSAYKQRLLSHGKKLKGCISCEIDPTHWHAHADESWPFPVIFSFGIHPWMIDDAHIDLLEKLATSLEAVPTAWVGEIGLDGTSRGPTDLDKADYFLNAQLDLAVTLQRPVLVHGTQAWGKLFDCLLKYVNHLPAVVVHGSSFSKNLLNHPFAKHLNVYFSVNGLVSHPMASRMHSLVQVIPASQLLVETDAPDAFPLGGEPLVLGYKNGLLNHPANLHMVIAEVAKLRDTEPEAIEALTDLNIKRLFASCV